MDMYVHIHIYIYIYISCICVGGMLRICQGHRGFRF